MNPSLARRAALLLSLAIGVGAGTAGAVDGVTEINDTSITAAGGYPFVVGTTGSYVLTGNLTPGPGLGALMVTAPDVEIDMNGFSIIGAGGPGGEGIAAAGIDGLSVRDGSISGMAAAAISTGAASRILRVRITANGSGIISASQCLIMQNFIRLNTGVGIDAMQCKIENNVITTNDGDGIIGAENVIARNEVVGNGFGAMGGGILSPGGSTIQENVITFNNLYGISDIPTPPAAPPPPPFFAPPLLAPRNNIMKNVIFDSVGYGVYTNLAALITDNTIGSHGLDGVICGAACTIRGNLVDSNNTVGTGNGGVTAGPGSAVNDNSISFNTGIGLVIDVTSGYTNNTLSANTLADAVAPPLAGPPPHPTSGFFNLCSGVPGPAPTCL